MCSGSRLHSVFISANRDWASSFPSSLLCPVRPFFPAFLQLVKATVFPSHHILVLLYHLNNNIPSALLSFSLSTSTSNNTPTSTSNTQWSTAQPTPASSPTSSHTKKTTPNLSSPSPPPPSSRSRPSQPTPPRPPRSSRAPSSQSAVRSRARMRQ